MKKALLTASVLLISGQVYALGGTGTVDLDFALTPVDGAYPCTIESVPAIDFGHIEAPGFYEKETEVKISCEADLDFTLFIAESETSSSSGHIYEDDYIHVYAGTKSTLSYDNAIFNRGYYNSSGDGCIKGGSTQYTRAITVESVSFYPVAGRTTHNSHTSNRNSCFKREAHNESGLYSVTIYGFLHVLQVPEDNELDSVPTRFELPLTLVPQVPIEHEPEY